MNPAKSGSFRQVDFFALALATLEGLARAVVSGKDLRSAVYAADGLDQIAKLLILSSGRSDKFRGETEVEELKCVFGG